MPYFSWGPKLSKNLTYVSLSSSSSLASSFLTFFSMFPLITDSCLSCCSISLEMFSDRSGESTIPLTNLKQSGSTSLHLSMIITPEEYSSSPGSNSLL